ncbi:MAG: cytochrome c [Pseudomonadota bacterium]
MKVKLFCGSFLALALAACGGAPSSDVAASNESPSISDSGELWDTSLTFGFSASEDATGLERGQQVYDQWCAICHADGVGMAGTDSLKRTYMMAGITDMSPILTERTDLTPEYIELVVRQGIKSMPYFRKTEVSDEDLALIGAYLAQNNPDYQEE